LVQRQNRPYQPPVKLLPPCSCLQQRLVWGAADTMLAVAKALPSHSSCTSSPCFRLQLLGTAELLPVLSFHSVLLLATLALSSAVAVAACVPSGPWVGCLLQLLSFLFQFQSCNTCPQHRQLSILLRLTKGLLRWLLHRL